MNLDSLGLPACQYLACNNTVACAPFESLAIEETVNKGFKYAKDRGAALSTKVVYHSLASVTASHAAIFVGDTVFVRASEKTMPWTREIFDIGGKKVILVPMTSIIFVARPPLLKEQG